MKIFELKLTYLKFLKNLSSADRTSKPLSSADLNESFSDTGEDRGEAAAPLENLFLPLVSTTVLCATSK